MYTYSTTTTTNIIHKQYTAAAPCAQPLDRRTLQGQNAHHACSSYITAGVSSRHAWSEMCQQRCDTMPHAAPTHAQHLADAFHQYRAALVISSSSLLMRGQSASPRRAILSTTSIRVVPSKGDDGCGSPSKVRISSWLGLGLGLGLGLARVRVTGLGFESAYLVLVSGVVASEMQQQS